MAFKCLKCGHKIGGVHLPKKCPKCKTNTPDNFIRVEDEDIDPAKYTKEKEWLESLQVQ